MSFFNLFHELSKLHLFVYWNAALMPLSKGYTHVSPEKLHKSTALYKDKHLWCNICNLT